jgi:hypothetical protein
MSKSNPVSGIRVAAQLAEHAREIRALSRRAIGGILEIGRRLVEAKALAGHGGWLSWLEREFGWSERTARNYMAAAERFKSATIADLDIDLRALYRLASPSTPAEVVEEVIARGRAGETITRRTVIEAEAERAVRVHYVSEPRPAPTVLVPYYVPVDQPEPVVRTIRYVTSEAEDPATRRIRAVAREVRRNLSAIADALAIHQIGEIITLWDDDDRERVRKGVEAVDQLKVALDRDNIVRFPDKPN